MNEEPIQDKPQDLSMKTARKLKPIPPPLDLNQARTLDSQEASDLRVPKSPAELLPRECLPIRKRPLLEVRRERDLQGTKSPKSAGPNGYVHAFSAIDVRHVNTAPSSPLGPHMHPRIPIASTLSLTPSSASSLASSVNSAFTHFPVPPPLIPGHPHSQVPRSPFMSAVAAAVSGGGNGFPTPPTDLHSPYPWPSPTTPLAAGVFTSPFSPHSPLPFPTTALLSPAASSSYPSSTNSSREDLPLGGGGGGGSLVDREAEARRRYISSAVSKSLASSAADSSSPVPSSPLLSPRTWSHSWPTPAWQCFVQGTMIKFIIPELDTPWQKAEDLGWKDKIAMKVDAMNQYQYAPSGLTIVKIDVISRETSLRSPASCSSSSVERHGSAFTPITSMGAADMLGGEVQTLLRLRMAPHRGDNSTEILAECSLDHPFFVKEKGWCSAQTRLTIKKYGIPCQDISVGDVCLPPNHPDAVRTPDLCDRLRRFEFDDPTSPLNSGNNIRHRLATTMATSVGAEPTRPGGGGTLAAARKSMMSPPMSPAKKKEKDPDKPKRPMNGFMLFAKKFRLELIQQHPGKDNRAISVLLGEAWKSLALEEREQYSLRAKLMADEQKKLYPDCWKRKRTVAITGAGSMPPQQSMAMMPMPPASPQSSSKNSPPTRPMGQQSNAVTTTTSNAVTLGNMRHFPLSMSTASQPPPPAAAAPNN